MQLIERAARRRRAFQRAFPRGFWVECGLYRLCFLRAHWLCCVWCAHTEAKAEGCETGKGDVGHAHWMRYDARFPTRFSACVLGRISCFFQGSRACRAPSHGRWSQPVDACQLVELHHIAFRLTVRCI